MSSTPDWTPNHQKALEFVSKLKESDLLNRSLAIITAQQNKIDDTRETLKGILVKAEDIMARAETIRSTNEHMRGLVDNLRVMINEAITERDDRIAELERENRNLRWIAALGAQDYPDLEDDYFSQN